MATEKLTDQICVPCRGDEPPLKQNEIDALKPQVPDWEVVTENNVPRLKRTFKFKNFLEALTFTQNVGEVAEAQGHHPVIVTEWGKVTISWWTHKIKGLHQNDFIMAAKSDALYANLG
jgi:4a-hydroxytetrahydrobiopterin dehydratase